MPAFYRMPVFYLVAAVLAGAAGASVWSRERSANEEAGRAAATKGVDAAHSPAARHVATPPPEPNDGILRTPEGLRRKVVVKDLDLVCRSDPVDGMSVGAPLDYFAIAYVYGETPAAAAKTMLQIGPREGPPQGWVPADSVLEWNTRLMARPTPDPDRPPLVIYREKSCLLDAMAGRRCPTHQGACPIEGEERGHSAANTSPAAGLPLLSSEETPEPDGSKRTIFEVASLVRDEAPIPVPKEPPRDFIPALRTVYIAFAIDTTASMQSSIDAVKRVAADLVSETARRYRDVTLRLSLVEYRDANPGYGFTTRVVTGFTDPSSFRTAIQGLATSKHKDGSVDEAVLAGLAVVLPRPPDEPLGQVQHLEWPSGRTGELASKMIILLGDAPDHARDLRTAEKLAREAEQAGITIATVSMPAGRSQDEEQRYQAQWHVLAGRSFLPRDRAQNFKAPIAPIELTLEDAPEVAPRLQALIDDRIEYARNLAALAAAEAEQRLAAYVNSQGLTLDQVYPVLVDLHRGEPLSKPRPDPRFQGRKAPSVRKGWIAEKLAGKPLVTVEVLMTRAELDQLISELTSLQQAAQGTARDLSDLLSIGTAAAAGESAFLAADRGDQTFAEHLRRRQGLPPARPDSLLLRTQADLLQADDSYRAALDQRLGATIERLIRRRNDPDWDNPKRTIQGMSLVPYELIDF